MSSHRNAVVVITGGSTGIGRVIARELARRGDVVVLVYLGSQRDADDAVQEILGATGTAMAIRADVRDDLDVERLFTEAAAAFGGIDVIVHTEPGSAALDRYAASRLRGGGTVLHLTEVSDLAREFRSCATRSDRSVRTAPDAADLVLALVERWRRDLG